MTSVHVVRLHLLRAEKRQPLIASICSRGKFDFYARGTAPSLFKWKRETYTLQRIFRNSSGSSRNFIGRIAGWLVPVWDVIVIELQQQLSPSLSLSEAYYLQKTKTKQNKKPDVRLKSFLVYYGSLIITLGADCLIYSSLIELLLLLLILSCSCSWC